MEKSRKLQQNVSFARKTAFQSYAAANHIMREHSPPLLNKGGRKAKQMIMLSNLWTAATLAGMFPLWLKVHSQIIPLQLTPCESIVTSQPDIIATTTGWARECLDSLARVLKVSPRSIIAFFAEKFISTMSSWLPASYQPPSRSVHFCHKQHNSNPFFQRQPPIRCSKDRR